MSASAPQEPPQVSPQHSHHPTDPHTSSVSLSISSFSFSFSCPSFSSLSYSFPDGRRVYFRSLLPSDLCELRRLNDSLFPVKYSLDYYHSLLDSDCFSLCGFIESENQSEQLICCASAKLRETRAHHTASRTASALSSLLCQRPKEIYLLTFGCSSAYRRFGLGFYLLFHFIRISCSLFPSASLISLHMKLGNESALRLYQKCGFAVSCTLTNYYSIDGQWYDAVLLTRPITLNDKTAGEELWKEQKSVGRSWCCIS